MKRESVMVAVPALDHNITSAVAAFCANLSSKGERDFEALYLADAKPVHYARNICVKRFLDGEYDKLWFMDADGAPTMDCMRILDVDADIALGLVPVWMPKGYNGAKVGSVVYNVYKWKNEAEKYLCHAPLIEGEPEDVDAGGCAMMVIKRRVLEDERMRFPGGYEDICGTKRELGAGDAPAIFRSLEKPNGENLLGEDMDFCKRAGGLGYTIKYAPGAISGHRKVVDLEAVMEFGQAMMRKAQVA